MRLWKKGICLLLAVAAMATVTACGSSSSQSEAPSSEEPVSSSEVPSSEAAAEEESSSAASSSETDAREASSEAAGEASSSESAGEGGTLVVYFSATGNTQAVAQTIADSLNADLYEIVPEIPYTSEDLNYSDENSRVSREHEDESLQNVELTSTTVDNWDSYDTVFIGYPIWWGEAAWPVDSFVENNDFTGKTVIPFCTSSSSGLGESGQLLAELAGTGDWQEGMRFRSSASEADVQEWIDSLSLS